MKTKLFIGLLLIFLLVSTVTAQVPGYCTTSDGSTNFSMMESVRVPDLSAAIIYVKIYVHVLAHSETGPGQSVLGVNEALKQLYENYDNIGIHFVWDGEILYVQNDDWHDNALGNKCDIINYDNHADGVDIYIGNSQIGDGFGHANGIGETSSFLVSGYTGIEAQGVFTFIPQSKVITHEMGHVLFLWHTFHGTGEGGGASCPGGVGDPNACAECLYSNILETSAWYCGDYVYDTRPDANLTPNFDAATCGYIGGGNDDCGNPLAPLASNFMSYAPLNCRTQFTHGQKRRMKNALSILPHLAATKLTEYAYVRGPNIACINELSQFFVYSDDLNGLTIELSDNFESETITVLSDRIEIELLGEFNNVEGSPGWIIVKRSGSEIGRKDFWVGIPQKMLPNTVQGSINVDPSEVKNYYIPERLEGAITHQWHFDLFDLVEQQPFVPGLLEWQYDHKTKYHNILSTMTGKCDGELFVYGLNDCGENMDMTENEGLNINVSGGDPNCPIPSPVPIVYYPNPADDLLEIDLTMQPYAPFVIKIYDGAQNLVLQEDSENVVKTMTMSTLVNGTYYMHIFDSGNNQILSVILIINH